MTKKYNYEKEIIADYLSRTLSVKDIGLKYGYSSYTINQILKNNNIEKYNYHLILPQNKRKYEVKEDYFDSENPNMAYILGILASDGTVRKDSNEVKLTLATKDRDFLEILQKEIGGRPIKEYEDKKGFKNVTWTFTSAHIKEQLAKYNIVPDKTYTFKFPTNLNKKYWIDFIRGYFDGDGCISTAGSSAIRFQIGSKTKDVLENIVKYFEELGISSVSIQKRNDNFYFIQYSSISARKIYNILYTEKCLYLPRKREKYEALI